jgi:hypothetical protein
MLLRWLPAALASVPGTALVYLVASTIRSRWPGHELAEQRFAGAVGVDVGGVNEVAARFQKGVVDFAALLFRRAPAPILAEGHRSQAQFRNAKSALAQQSVAHDALPLKMLTNRLVSSYVLANRLVKW